MKLAIYQEITLNCNIATYNLNKGNIATLIDYAPHPKCGESGAFLEVFNICRHRTCIEYCGLTAQQYPIFSSYGSSLLI